MDKKEMKKWIFLILIAVLSYWGINNLNVVFSLLSKTIDILFPFILGASLAFILNIPMVKIEKSLNTLTKSKKSNGLMRVFSIILSLLLLGIIIGLVAFLLIPELVQNIELLIDNMPTFIEKVENFILDLLDKYPDIQVKIADAFNKNADISSILGSLLNYIVNGAISFISSLVSGIISLFTAIIFAIYMLSQKEYLIKGSKKLIYAYLKKERAERIIEIGRLANNIFSKFISGQCLEAVILGSIFFGVLSIFKFPYALLISVLTTVTALVPIVGALIAMVIGAVLILITNPIQALIFIGIFLLIQQIEENFIYPKIVGKSVGLSPIWTLMAISVGGSLGGILGMLLGLPIASIVYALLKNDANEKLKVKRDINLD